MVCTSAYVVRFVTITFIIVLPLGHMFRQGKGPILRVVAMGWACAIGVVTFAFGVVLPIPIAPTVRPGTHVQHRQIITRHRQRVNTGFLHKGLAIVTTIIRVRTTLRVVIRSRNGHFIRNVLRAYFHFSSNVDMANHIRVINGFVRQRPAIRAWVIDRFRVPI